MKYHNTSQYKNKKQNQIQMKVRTKEKILIQDHLHFQ